MIIDVHSTMRTVFTIFGIFWVGVIAVLFLATGLLLKRADKMRQKMHGSEHH